MNHAQAIAPLRVTFLCVMPSPYMQDFFQAIAADGRICPRVYYMELAQPGTHWRDVRLPDYAKLLPGGAIEFARGRIQWNRGVLDALRADEPELVVINSYSGVTTQLAMAWLRFKRLPWVFWGEIPGLHHRGRFGTAARRLAQSPIAHGASGVAAIGSRAVSAYQQLTSGRCPVANIPYHCDLDALLAIKRPDRWQHKPIRFLYCGQLIHRKGVDLLLEAFLLLANRYDHVQLTLVGTGPLQRALGERVPPTLAGRVHFLGFKQIAELPDILAVHDVFVLPSRHDGWGVVVNQAIAAGLPAIVTDAVGAGDDLVLPDQNGVIVGNGNFKALSQALELFVTDPEKIVAFGAASRALARQWTPQQGVDRWWQLCNAVLSRHRSPTSLETAHPTV